MIATDQLKKATCHVLQATGAGTGIFIGNGEILTCRHVVKNLSVGDEVNVCIGTNEPFVGNIKAFCKDTDLALIVTGYQNSEYMTLVDCEIPVGTDWACHGHPDTVDGRTVGAPMRGKVIDFIEDSTATTHDISLSVKDTRLEPTFKGYSGSGVITENGKVIAIMRYKNENYLSGVSVRKAAGFLRSHGIHVEDGVLDNFTDLISEAFIYFEEGIREICLMTGKKVAQLASPQTIVEQLKGNLFYPTDEKSVKDIITMLIKDADTNKSLWLGWLRFLTYIAMLRGEYKEVNNITIALGKVELSRVLDVEISPIEIDLNITLKFFFTAEKSFVTVVTEYLYDKIPAADVKANTCHVFESGNSQFGRRPFTAEKKRNIVKDISNANGGLQVVENMDFGILSLNQLSDEVAKSQDWAAATINLKTLFKNVIIQS